MPTKNAKSASKSSAGAASPVKRAKAPSSTTAPHGLSFIKIALVASLTLNLVILVFVGSAVYQWKHAATSGQAGNVLSDLTNYEYKTFCSDPGYSRIMDIATKGEDSTSRQQTEQMVAFRVCGVDYKTGKPIDLNSLKPDNSQPAYLPPRQ